MTNPDEDDDLSTQDRGDDFAPGDEAADDKSGDEAADDKSGDGAADDKSGGEADDAAEKAVEKARDEKGRFAKKEEEEEEEEEDDGDEDARRQNFPIRLNKAKEQRDAAVARAEAAERELQAIRAGKPAPAAEKPDPGKVINDKLDALYEQVEELRADGDTKAAARLQREIDALNRELSKMEIEPIAVEQASRLTENERYNAMLDTLESEINVLNPQHEDFDPDAVRALTFYTEAHEKMGMPATKALQQAAKVVFGYAATKPAAKSDAGKDAPAKKDEKVVPIKKTDVSKAVDTAKKQPPDMADRGVNPDDKELDPDKLSDEDFAKLPESKKAQMRGDFG